MTFKPSPVFEAMTQGQRMAARGHVGSRPWDDDWQEQQATLCVDLLRANPWVQSVVGVDITVRVGTKKGKLVFELASSVKPPAAKAG